MAYPELRWLPTDPAWPQRLAAVEGAGWAEFVGLARTRLDFLATERLDRALRRRFPGAPEGPGTSPLRLALLGSATLAHLQPALRIAALRRGFGLAIHENAYGQYLQELFDPGSTLHRFRPEAVLFALDTPHVLGAGAGLGERIGHLRRCWRLARALCPGPVIQQTLLPSIVPRLGANEHRLDGSPAAAVARLNAALRTVADEEGVDLLALDEQAARDGLDAWHDPALWHRAKQEVRPPAAPFWGELALRLIAARRGGSAKCLVLDLDNTLWGGVVGDDGVEGIVLGQGSAEGEAFLEVQRYVRDLAARGVILAVCSKNDEANALAPFERHPEMLLRRDDISCFMANWQDKAANLRAIAGTLGIGLDSLVLLDDSPYERAQVRAALPMVLVPEVPEEPALVPRLLAEAGYFEAVAVTGEDRARAAQYQANHARVALRGGAPDLGAYLASLEMRLSWRRFDRLGLARIVQLVNKTNQFNLTTRRTSEAEIAAVMADPEAVGLQLRLTDRFGDNGVIAVVIARREVAQTGVDLDIGTWLMSCRVLGRTVEDATLAVIAGEAHRLGAGGLRGTYLPSEKNAMVASFYDRLGFRLIRSDAGGAKRYRLDLAAFTLPETAITVIAEDADTPASASA